MHTTPLGGRPPTGSGFPARFGNGPARERLPLRQAWELLPSAAHAPAPPAWDALHPAHAKFALVQQGTQGEIRALNERALRTARTAVEQAHPGGVRFTRIEIHTYLDPVRRVPMEPLMFVKVNARREHLAPILQDLRARGARLHEVELQRARVLLRAEARLAALMGFEDAVLALGTHSAQVFSWLLRYEPAVIGEE